MKCQHCGEFAVRDDICYDCWVRAGHLEPISQKVKILADLSKIVGMLWKHDPEAPMLRVYQRRLEVARGVSALPSGPIKVRGLK